MQITALNLQYVRFSSPAVDWLVVGYLTPHDDMCSVPQTKVTWFIRLTSHRLKPNALGATSGVTITVLLKELLFAHIWVTKPQELFLIRRNNRNNNTRSFVLQNFSSQDKKGL